MSAYFRPKDVPHHPSCKYLDDQILGCSCGAVGKANDAMRKSRLFVWDILKMQPVNIP
jgi:hypothetical protein